MQMPPFLIRRQEVSWLSEEHLASFNSLLCFARSSHGAVWSSMQNMPSISVCVHLQQEAIAVVGVRKKIEKNNTKNIKFARFGFEEEVIFLIIEVVFNRI